ncbi:hypothetical protein GCM10012290_02540 [Halolactibacillus alkaliphilus]|nr:hypothetical protein GCM10012290_02540 [Halolactibacillus alkaliphilus]
MADTTSTIIDQMSGILGTITFDREPDFIKVSEGAFFVVTYKCYTRLFYYVPFRHK